MSIYRRSVIARCINKVSADYVEGYCVSPFPETIGLRYYYSDTQYSNIDVQVNQNDGSFRYYFEDNVVTLISMFDLTESRNKLKSVKLVLRGAFYGSLQNAFRRQSYLEEIDLSSLIASNSVASSLTYAFCLNDTDNNNGYFSSLVRCSLPSFLVSGQPFRNCDILTTINHCGAINESIDFSFSPINIESAKLILSSLQPVSSSKSVTFSSITKGYINADSEALQLVAEKRLQGWTIVL